MAKDTKYSPHWACLVGRVRKVPPPPPPALPLSECEQLGQTLRPHH